MDRFGAKASKATQAASRQKMIDRIELVEIKDSNIFKPFFNFHQNKPSGKSVIKVDNLHKQFSERILLKEVTFLFIAETNARFGPYGIGKSTLLKILLRELQRDQGCFEWSDTVNVGYFSQDYRLQLDPTPTVLEWMEEQVVSTFRRLGKYSGRGFISWLRR